MEPNKWQHVAFVFRNSDGVRRIYIDGESYTSTSGPNKTSTPYGIPDTVQLFGGNFEGYVCDYREYATALSADDIKELYNTEASIDNKGNIFTYQLIEK